jgi:transposase
MSTAAPLPEASCQAPDSLPRSEHLPDDLVTLKRMIMELLATLQAEQRDKQQLRERLDRLLQRLYGPKQERYDPNELTLFDVILEAGAATEVPATPPESETPSSSRQRNKGKPHGRGRWSDKLPRRERHHRLSEAEQICTTCSQPRIDIGADMSEQLDYQPASVFVWQDFVHKYLCPHCSKKKSAATEAAGPAANGTPAAPLIVAATKPAAPIDRGLPGPGLLAYLIVSKYADHLPLYRLEQILARQGANLKRSTLCDWLAACATALTPLYDLMVGEVMLSRVIHTDDTSVTLQEHEPDATAKSRVWAYLGDEQHPYNVFQFTPNRKRDGPREFLRDYRGYLQADAFSGYDILYLPDPVNGVAPIVEVACNAHARRKFYDARSSDAARAHQALAWYGQLFELERRAQPLDDAQRRQLRQDVAVPILNQFKIWLEKERPQVTPKHPMAEAIGYALNQWDALVRYTDEGFLNIDNNWAEREMKRIAIGRKNWLFFGNANGGKTAVVLMSFTSTCHRLGVEPWAYLSEVLRRMPTISPEQLPDLLPTRWKPIPATGNEPSAAAAGQPKETASQATS